MAALLLLSLCLTQQTNWRTMLDKAYQNEQAAETMMQALKQIPHPDPLEKAYLGTVHLLLADHASMPWTKYQHFRKGATLLDEAAQEDKDNAEIRYLRYACQTNTPEFLGYNEAIEVDKAILMWHLTQSADADLTHRIRKILVASKHTSEQEKRKVGQP